MAESQVLEKPQKSQKKHCVVIVGAGFAGFNAARELSRLVGDTTEIVVINSTDYFLYLPLMPQVAGGLVEPARTCACRCRGGCPRSRFVLGTCDPRRPQQRWCAGRAPTAPSGEIAYDRV